MTRRPPTRRRRRRSRRSGGGELLGIVFVAAAAVSVVAAVVTWLLEHWWVLIAAGLAAAAGLGGWLYHRAERARWEQVRARGLRYTLAQLDGLHHRQFEYAIRDLMRRDGCADAVQVGGAGDNGADVKATDPFGRRWVIQCKHRRDGLAGAAVGTPDLHVLNGTARQLHGAEVVVLVTNGRFSSKCPPLAASQRMHLVDRQSLGQWAAGSRPLWELLQRLPPPRRPSALS